LQAGEARLDVTLRGAEPLRWRIGDIDLLWASDPGVWPETAPILFPIVGWTRDGIRVGAERYPLGLHGFAREKPFTLVECSAQSAHFRLCDDAQSRALYPFAFTFDVFYELRDDSLVWRLSVANAGPAPMPYAVGLHPGFCWPLAGSAKSHRIVFERAERPDVPVIAPGGLFSPDRRTAPLRGRSLELTPDAFAREALCFLDVASRSLVFENGAGAQLSVALDGFAHVALWARPPAPFLCIEAWTGYGDPVGFDGALADKPSMIILPPGGVRTHSATFRFEKAPSALAGASAV
jgi:galactose mutarotase-like enzyme